MHRRQFTTLIGGAIAWPSVVRAQPAPSGAPLVGFLGAGLRDQRPYLVPAIRKGLNEAGFAEVAVEYRYAEGHCDRLRDLANELLLRNVSVIIADGVTATMAAKAVTEKVPIIFKLGGDPVRLGLVGSISPPDTNLTGLVMFGNELIAKRLQILRELVPKDATIGLLVNPNSPNAAALIKEVQAAAKAMDQAIQTIEASSESQLDAAFASLRNRQIAAILAHTDPFLDDHLQQLVALGSRYGVPAIYQWRQFAEAGALLSYGPNLPNFYRQVAVYAGRILKGAKPSDLPVEQPTKLELVINLKTAKTDHHSANSARSSRRGYRMTARLFIGTKRIPQLRLVSPPKRAKQTSRTCCL
jgi:putative ABC transport system substrate-binding protein